jgi:cbb3-type cytochrome oxidase cytochrome c subunit
VAVPVAPPVLVGERQGVGVVMSGSLGLLVLSLLLSVFLPSLQQPGNGIRSSNHPFSSAALEGRDVYASQGCASCHTQLIRNVVTDVGLGPVTLDDTNQIIGYRRIGPDLSAIGARIEDSGALIALLAGEGGHPAATGLSEADLANLVAYLRESR